VREALEAARPVLKAIGAALGPDAEVLLVPGNHDHRLVAPWLERRGGRGAPPPLGLEERAGPRASDAVEALARALRPARVDVAYPGVWLGEDVYATHGHYLDRHVTVPSFERLAAGTLARILGARAAEASTPDDYELVLAPLYALLDAVAARTVDGHGPSHAHASAKAWSALTRESGRPLRSRLLTGAFPVAIAALNATGIGPVRPDLSGPELRRAGLAAMREVAGRLGLRVRHLIFGHTHRAGPLPGEDPWDWTLPGGGTLINAGSWVYEDAYLRHGWTPYWPGGAVALEEKGSPSPRLMRLLDGVDGALLRP